MKTKLFSGIKKTSTVLITGAIGLEAWAVYTVLLGNEIPDELIPVLGLGAFALTAHLIEGTIAAFYAPGKQENPTGYGVYTFFVGTVGLLELFDIDKDKIESLEPES